MGPPTLVFLLSVYSVSGCAQQSLDVELNPFNVHIFINSILISTQSKLNVISSRLGKLLTEPGAPVTALQETSHTALAIPQSVSISVGVGTFIFTAVVIANKWREVGELIGTASARTVVLMRWVCRDFGSSCK